MYSRIHGQLVGEIMSNHEVWRPVPGFAGYEASSLGRVRNAKRKRPLSPIPHRGYFVVKLGHPNLAYGVHQVVAMAFNGPCPSGMVIDHVDTNKTNNRPENLEYVTNAENVRRAHSMGLMHASGEGNGACKLTDLQVSDIRQRAATTTNASLAREFGVTKTQIGRIVNNQSRMSA